MKKIKKTAVKISILKNPNRAIPHKKQAKIANPNTNFSSNEIFIFESEVKTPSPIDVRKIVNKVATEKNTKSVPPIREIISNTETSTNKLLIKPKVQNVRNVVKKSRNKIFITDIFRRMKNKNGREAKKVMIKVGMAKTKLCHEVDEE